MTAHMRATHQVRRLPSFLLYTSDSIDLEDVAFALHRRDQDGLREVLVEIDLAQNRFWNRAELAFVEVLRSSAREPRAAPDRREDRRSLDEEHCGLVAEGGKQIVDTVVGVVRG